MSNELEILATQLQLKETQLQLAQKDNELMQIKLELEKTQAKKLSKLEDSLFSQNLYAHYYKIAELLARSSAIPTNYRGKPEDVFVAMAAGYKLGFPVEQALQDIAVINGRPCLWGDGLMAVVLAHPDCESINEEPIIQDNKIVGFRCTVKRKGNEPHTQVFTLQDAQNAGLLAKGGVWKQYPSRMLQMRARNLALRDKFADALRGLRTAEVEKEDSNIIEGEVTQVISNTDKVKNFIKENSNYAMAQSSSNTHNIDKTDMVESSNSGFENQDANSSFESKTDLSEDITNKTPSEIDDERIATKEQISRVQKLMLQLKFTTERVEGAFKYYKINSLAELKYNDADKFIAQLEKEIGKEK